MSSPPVKGIFSQRRPKSEVTDAYEDSGLFKSGVCQITVELIPQSRENDRGDVITCGFADRKFEIDVLFAGRRVAEIGPLLARLKGLLRAAQAMAKAAGNGAPKVETLRLPVRAEGAWRRTIKRDETGWETTTYHFVVARWSLLDQNGKAIAFGSAPVLS